MDFLTKIVRAPIVSILSFLSFKCNDIIPPTTKPANVIIWHEIGRNGTLDKIRELGLCSYNELYRQRLIEYKSDIGMRSDHYDSIYFDPQEKPLIENCVGLVVDPIKTVVCNREFRPGYDKRYNQSCIFLYQFLAHQERAKQMKKEANPSEAVIYDPFSGKPFYVNKSDKRFYDSNKKTLLSMAEGLSPIHYRYLPEVVIRTPRIPPEQLIFPDEDHTEQLSRAPFPTQT